MMPLVGLPAAFLVSAVYAYVNVYLMVFGFISVILFALYVGGVSLPLLVAARWSNCRSPAIAGLIGFVCGLFALYSWWAVFLYALLRQNADDFDATLLDVFLSPDGIWRTARAIAANGWFEIRGAAPKGLVLWGMWAVEAACVVGAATFGAMATSWNEVFCERCGCWCDDTKLRFGFGDQPHLLFELGPDNLAPLAELQPRAPRNQDHVRLDIWQCKSCHETSVLQVNRVSISRDKDGKRVENADAITKRLIVTPELIETVRQIKRGPADETIDEIDEDSIDELEE